MLASEQFEQALRNVAQRLSQISTATSRNETFTQMLGQSGSKAQLAAMEHRTEIHFQASTMDMLADCTQRFDEIIDRMNQRLGIHTEQQKLELFNQENTSYHRGFWLSFARPLPYLDTQIQYLFCMSPVFYIPTTGKDGFQLLLISPSLLIVDAIWINPPEAWGFDPDYPHSCLACHRTERKILEPCLRCGTELVIWSKTFAMSALITQQYLAEREYLEEIHTFSRRKKREKSNKERVTHVKHTIRTIDASRILVPFAPPEQQESPRELGVSWVEQAQEEGDLIYREVRTRPFDRTYRHPRYTNMRGQTVMFPKGIAQRRPMRPSLDGKRIINVKASKYQSSLTKEKE